MPLPHWIWKPDRVGAIAMAKLVFLEICPLTLLLARDERGSVLQSVAGFGLLLFSFPLGWLGEVFFGGIHLLPVHAIVSFPLNAYLWGGLLELVLQRRAEARRFGLPVESSGDSVDRERQERSED